MFHHHFNWSTAGQVTTVVLSVYLLGRLVCNAIASEIARFGDSFEW